MHSCIYDSVLRGLVPHLTLYIYLPNTLLSLHYLSTLSIPQPFFFCNPIYCAKKSIYVTHLTGHRGLLVGLSEPCPVGGRNGSGFGVLPYVWSSHSGIRRKEGNGNRIRKERERE